MMIHETVRFETAILKMHNPKTVLFFLNVWSSHYLPHQWKKQRKGRFMFINP